MIYFKYGQEEGYWEGIHLFCQVKKQVLPITTALYPNYQYLFLFDNTTSHPIYMENAVCVQKINKGTRE